MLHEQQNTSNRGNESVRMYGADLSQAWEVISNFQDKKKKRVLFVCFLALYVYFVLFCSVLIFSCNALQLERRG